MSKSTRFPAAVHIMTMLAAMGDDYLSSDLIAKSMNTNRVVVRRLIKALVDAGFVTSQAGVLGGARLEVSPKDITLLDIYRAVEDGDTFHFHSPHPKCPVANCVTEDLQVVLDDAESAMEKKLASKTLADVAKRGIAAMKRGIAVMKRIDAASRR